MNSDRTLASCICRPFLLTGAVKRALWGRGRLTETGQLNDTQELSYGTDPAAECWIVSVRQKREEQSKIEGLANGEVTLADVLLEQKSIEEPTSFPYLVKVIDTNAPLSVQVHPDDSYAIGKGLPCGKFEMWYILEAEPDAKIAYGLLPDVTLEEFTNACAEGKTDEMLAYCPVHPGEVWFVPSGLPHAIGKGILLVEVQQNADVTYRVYDYNRKDSTGKTRPLHLEDALAVIRPFSDEEIMAARYSAAVTEPDENMLAVTSHFSVYLLDNEADGKCITEGEVSVFALEDCTIFTLDEERIYLPKLRAMYLPKDMGACRLCGRALLIRA